MENVIEEPAVSYTKHYTEEAYLNMQWEDGVRYEYWDGELVPMSYTTQAHNRITFNVNRVFHDKKGKDGCGSFQENVMLRRDNENIYFLPDVLLTCHQDDLDPKSYQIKNPSIIVEVLSESTESYDRNQKWRQYQKIKSLKYFLLISQVEYRVEMFSRPNDLTLFFYQSFEDLDAVIHFEDLGFSMSLKEIYEGISLEVQQETGSPM
jgi:Uma2 family endonuclease